jgi:hypothetical protein
MANPVAYAGRGTVIAFTVAPVTGGSTYVALPQLEKFEKTSAKVDFDDATCLDSPGNNKFPVPVVVDNGKWGGEGIFDPQNPNITALLGYMQAMTQLGFKVTLIDGSTFVGLCYVESFGAAKIDRYKVNSYDFAINVFGVETLTPIGGGAIAE